MIPLLQSVDNLCETVYDRESTQAAYDELVGHRHPLASEKYQQKHRIFVYYSPSLDLYKKSCVLRKIFFKKVDQYFIFPREVLTVKNKDDPHFNYRWPQFCLHLKIIVSVNLTIEKKNGLKIKQSSTPFSITFFLYTFC